MKWQLLVFCLVALLASLPPNSRAADVEASFAAAGQSAITADGYTAEGKEIALSLAYPPIPGDTLVVVGNTGTSPISGEFLNLVHRQEVTLSFDGKRYPFVANYRGGDGNDLVLHWARQAIHLFGAPQPEGYAGPAGLGSVGNTGRMTALPVPEEVLAGLPAVAVWANYLDSFARLADGTWMTWTNADISPFPPPEVFPMAGPLEGKTIHSLVAGPRHYLALCEDGTLVTWGINDAGQIGNGETGFEWTPVPPVEITGNGALAGRTVVQVAAGERHSLALCSDGSIVAWGDNFSGQLGDATGSSSPLPVLVSSSGVLAGRTVTGVRAAGNFSAALSSDGKVVTWGSNSDGQLGDGDIFDAYEPVAVDDSGALAGKAVVDLALAESHVIALCADGSLAAWGANHLGTLGDGTRISSHVPVSVGAPGLADGESIASLDANAHVSFLRTDQGRQFGWGGHIGADLGVAAPDGGVFPGPMTLYGNLEGATLMDFGVPGPMPVGIVALPLKSDSSLAGLALDGAVLDQDVHPARPHYVAALRAGVTETVALAVAADPDAVVAVNGVELPPEEASSPIPVAPGGAALSVVVTAQDGSATGYTVDFIESSDLEASLTAGAGPARSAPAFELTGRTAAVTLAFHPEPGAVIPLLENTGLNAIGGRFSNLAHGQIIDLTFEGLTYPFIANYHGGTGNDLVLEWARRKVVAWGDGALGGGPDSLPVEVGYPGILHGKTIIEVAVGSSHGLALCTDGSLYAWGRNDRGQLGDGGSGDASAPVAVDRSGVLADKEIVAIAAGWAHSVVLCADGTVAAWGANSQGQLGDGTEIDSPVPVRSLIEDVYPFARAVALAVGADHTVVRFSNGRLAAWGSSEDGQVGANPPDSLRFAVPTAVGGELAGKTVVDIIAGDSHNHAICGDGTLWAWGRNREGALADGTFENRSLPAEMSELTAVASLPIQRFAAGREFSLAVDAEGRMFSWGGNREGQLGRQSTSVLEAVGEVDFEAASGGGAVRSIISGYAMTLATSSSGPGFGWGSNNGGVISSNGASNLTIPWPLRADGALAGAPLMKIDVEADAVALVAPVPSDALAGLEVSAGFLAPDFDPEVVDYRLNLPSGPGPFHLTAVPLDRFGQVRINGAPVDPAGGPVTIDPASERIEVEVTSDTGTQRLYAVELVDDITHTFTTAGGPAVTLSGYHASGRTAQLTLGFEPPPGTALTVVENLGIGFIDGEFDGLAQGEVVTLPFAGSDHEFIVNYHGGSGNDLVLEWARRELAGWGYNGRHELADGTTELRPVPVAPLDLGDLAGRTVLSVAIGQGHSVALCSDGSVVAWGDGVAAPAATPTALGGALAGRRAIAISAAHKNALALCADGTIAAWGEGAEGQLGNGSFDTSTVPVAVDASGVLSGKKIVAVSCGGTHCLALASDGTVFSWGSNSHRQLGAGLATNIRMNVPVAVDAESRGSWLSGRQVTAIATGLQHSLALCSDGTLAGWGASGAALAGAGGGASPRQIEPHGALAGKTVVALANGARDFTCVLCSDGTVVTWGVNGSGQLGTGSTSPGSATPLAVDTRGVLAGKTVVSVASGYAHTIATCSDGTIVTWGGNEWGQLGDGTRIDRSAPVLAETRGVLFGRHGLNGAAGFHTLAVVAKPVAGYIDFISRFPHLGDQRDEADPDGDGIANLIEFVSGTRPDLGANASLPQVVRSETDACFAFTRDVSTVGQAIHRFEWSENLVTWHRVDLPTASGGSVVLGNTDANQVQQVEVRVPLPASGRLFGRVYASRP